MTYKLIHNESGRVLAEAKRISDSYLVQEVRGCFSHGCFADGSVSLFKNGAEIDPASVTDKDNERMDKAYARKCETHKQISVIDGVSGFKRKTIWVRK